MDIRQIKVYTDGSCLYNPGGAGGWAYIILDGKKEKRNSGNIISSTNQRMEMTAVIKALKCVQKTNNQIITVYSDSAYIVNCMNQNWIGRWERNNWKTSSKESVKNQDLWREMIKYLKPNIRFVHVKGHNGNKYNEEVDKLAKEAALKIGLRKVEYILKDQFGKNAIDYDLYM